eukprot:tig00020723_g13455.t1
MGQFVGRCLARPATPREHEQTERREGSLSHLYASDRSDSSMSLGRQSLERSATPEPVGPAARGPRRLSDDGVGVPSRGRLSGARGNQHNLSFVDQHVDSFSSFGSTDDERSSFGPDSHLGVGGSSLVRNPSWESRLNCDMKPCKKSVTEDGKKVINEYALLKKLGQGSYGKVYLAETVDTHKRYAIKMIKKSIFKTSKISNVDKMDMMFREIAIMKRLDHINIVHLYDVIDDRSGQAIYLVMEYVEGGPVMNCEQERAPLPEETARNYFRDIITGLDFVHSNHIVHMDIKPENLLVGADGRVRITDFGVSSIFQGSNDMINRCKGGSPAFTAPEIILGESSYSGKLADIWAVGVSLYYLVFGRCPFTADSIAQLFYRIANAELEFPRRVSPDLEDLIRRLLTKSPAERITMAALLRHPWVTEGGRRPIHSAGRKRPLTFPMMVKIKTTMRKRAIEARRVMVDRQSRALARGASAPAGTAPPPAGPSALSSSSGAAAAGLSSSHGSLASLTSSAGSSAASSVPLLSVTAPSPTVPEDWPLHRPERRRSSPGASPRSRSRSRSRSRPPTPTPPRAPAGRLRPPALDRPEPPPEELPPAPVPMEEEGYPFSAIPEEPEPTSPGSRSLPDGDWDDEAGARDRPPEISAPAPAPAPAPEEEEPARPVRPGGALAPVTLDDIKVVLQVRPPAPPARPRSLASERPPRAAEPAAAAAAAEAGGDAPRVEEEEAPSAGPSARALAARGASYSDDEYPSDSSSDSGGAGGPPPSAPPPPPSASRAAARAAARRPRGLRGRPRARRHRRPRLAPPSASSFASSQSGPRSPQGDPFPQEAGAPGAAPARPPSLTALRSASSPCIRFPTACAARRRTRRRPLGTAAAPWNQHAERLAEEFAALVATRRGGRRDSTDSDSTTLSEFIGTPSAAASASASASQRLVRSDSLHGPAGDAPAGPDAGRAQLAPARPRPPAGHPEHSPPAGSGPASPASPAPLPLPDSAAPAPQRASL